MRTDKSCYHSLWPSVFLASWRWYLAGKWWSSKDSSSQPTGVETALQSLNFPSPGCLLFWVPGIHRWVPPQKMHLTQVHIPSLGINHDHCLVDVGGMKVQASSVNWEDSKGPSSLRKTESSVKKPEHQRIDAFELWYWRRLLRIPWTERRSNQSTLKEISPEYSWKDWCWSWNSNILATWCEELTHWKRPWC